MRRHCLSVDNGNDLFGFSGCVYPVCRYACHRKCCQKTTTKCSKKVSRPHNNVPWHWLCDSFMYSSQYCSATSYTESVRSLFKDKTGERNVTNSCKNISLDISCCLRVSLCECLLFTQHEMVMCLSCGQIFWLKFCEETRVLTSCERCQCVAVMYIEITMLTSS